jgi:hypothetical protein
LIPGLIQVVTSQMAATNTGLTIGKIAVRAWPGPPSNPSTHSGVKWINGDNWTTYQKTNFVTPAFPGYFSGHSTFSRSAAEVLAGITGSIFFPGGMGSYSNYTLTFENGPSQPVALQWATYYDAADQAGISRIWGGIHPPVDNLEGRRAGAQSGQAVWALASQYWNGSIITNCQTTLSLVQLGGGTNAVRCNTLRGLYYKLQSTTNLEQPFTDEPGGSTLAYDSWLTRTNAPSGMQKFYRMATSISP